MKKIILIIMILTGIQIFANYSYNYKYTIKNNEVYWDEELIEGADSKTFKILGEGYYAKDKNNIYYKGEKFEGNPDTLKIIDNHYYKDKYSAYFEGIRINNSNPKTFKVLGRNFSKDNRTNPRYTLMANYNFTFSL